MHFIGTSTVSLLNNHNALSLNSIVYTPLCFESVTCQVHFSHLSLFWHDVYVKRHSTVKSRHLNHCNYSAPSNNAKQWERHKNLSQLLNSVIPAQKKPQTVCKQMSVVAIKLYLWTLITEFHLIFTCHGIVLFWLF